VEIRSYRNVFELERRIYRIEGLRLNPAGVPIRGIVYFLALIVCALVGGRLPLLHTLAQTLPWYVRDVALPALAAAALTIIRIEGRPFHLAALALARYGASAREFAGVRPRRAVDRRWRPDELLVLVDGSDARLRRLRYTGPGAVLVSAAHVRAEWRPGSLRGLARRPNVTVAPLPGRRAPARGDVIALSAGARLQVNAAQEHRA
jgi:hypothetical protein